jgi:hypothetical protein
LECGDGNLNSPETRFYIYFLFSGYLLRWPVTETFIESINIEIVLLRTRSKENTFYENPFYSRRERVLCKIYKRDSWRPATSRAAQQILSAVERCAKRRAAKAAKKRSGAAVGGRDPGAAATSRT